jgi:predicted 2-oxoglutarate/Fe(II)-dependent dioxygenase YbiX/peroxiredoxin
MSDHPFALTSRIAPGDPAPWFSARTPANPRYTFDTAAGRYIVLCFLASGGDPQAQAAMRAALGRDDLFNDRHAALFMVSTDPDDEASARLSNRIPGIRIIWDFDQTISTAYGAAPQDSADGRCWIVIDPTLRVIANMAFRADGGDAAQLMALLETLPPPERFSGGELQAPVLMLPRVFEPEFCSHLIDLYDANGGTESGFMREIGGRTVGVHDHNHKRRKDHILTDPALILDVQKRFLRRVVPEIAKIHQFTVTRMERYIVSCYAAEDGGHFAAHRDNTTAGTAHRRFAVSVNLNDDFDGGEVSFPEYGPRGFKAPPGGAVVFSCSLLHKVSRVTRGRRYAFLPFLYDDAAAQIRQKNASLIGEARSG